MLQDLQVIPVGANDLGDLADQQCARSWSRSSSLPCRSTPPAQSDSPIPVPARPVRDSNLRSLQVGRDRILEICHIALAGSGSSGGAERSGGLAPWRKGSPAPVRVPRVRVLVELAFGPFVAADLGSPFPAGAEPVDGTLVLLLRMSHDVLGWPVVDAGTRRPALRIPPSLRLPGGGQNPAPIRMAGNFHGQSRIDRTQ